MSRLLSFLFLLGATAIFGQHPLPYVRDGKWSVIGTDGRELVKTPYSYIHTFDEQGLAYFSHNGSYGVLNREGKEIVPAIYADVKQNGKGHFALRNENGWLHFVLGNNRLICNDTLESFESMEASWALIGKKGELELINLVSQQHWPAPDSNSYRFLYDHLVYRQHDSLQFLYDPSGKEILRGRFYISEQNGLVHAYRESSHYLFDASGAWNVGKILEVRISPAGVFIYGEGDGALYDYDRSVLVRGDYDYIGPFSETYWIGYSDAFATLIDRTTKKQALPFRYDDIESLPNGRFHVFRDVNVGLLDAHFREIIPCRYNYYYLNGDIAQVYDAGFCGLYSIKTGRELIPPNYNRIVQNGNRYKAYRNDLLSLFEINDAHQVVGKAQIDNVLSVHLAGRRGSVSGRKRHIDYRLFSVGWFLDSTLVSPPQGDPFYSVKWGLKDSHDSVLIPASIAELRYVPNAPYSMQHIGRKRLKNSQNRTVEVGNSRAIFLPTGKAVGESFIAYDTSDYLVRSYMRANTEKGFGILKEDGKWYGATYIEPGTNTYLSYCQGEKIRISEKERADMVPVPSLGFGYTYIELPVLREEENRNKNVKGLIFPDARWNYFTPEGAPLFKEDFAFAKPFVGKQAIVQVKKAWGVVSPDTLIIPAVYSKIERKIIERDTFFVAQLPQPGMRLLDTLSRTLEPVTIVGSRGPCVIIEREGLKYLCDERLRPISEGYATMKFLKNGFVQARQKKEITWLNSEGTVLFSGEEAPDEILLDRFLVFRKGSSAKLFDTGMNPLSEESFSSVEAAGDFLVVRREGKSAVYNAQFEQLAGKLDGTVLVDSPGGQFAVVNTDRITVFDRMGKKAGSFRAVGIKHFISGRLLADNGDSCRMYAVSGQLLYTSPAVEEIEVLKNGAVHLKLKSRGDQLFDRDWKRLLPEENRLRNVRALSDDHYAFFTSNGRMQLYNAQTDKRDSAYLEHIGGYENDRLLVKKKTGLLFLDADFMPLSAATYTRAIPYKGSFAAVGDARGWTMIDHSGQPLGYPNFGPIEALQPGLFQTAKLPFYGVFDTQGKNRIPVIYEQISFLPGGIVQCVKEGAFEYYRVDGTKLVVQP